MSNLINLVKYIKSFFVYFSFILVLAIFYVAANIIQESTNPTAKLSKILLNPENKILKAFFSPQNNIKDIIINIINHEQSKIYLAIYSFTDPDIAKALIDAHNRGVRVEIIVDKCYIGDKFSRVSQLANSGIFITVFQPDNTNNSGAHSHCLMHNKFFIFDRNLKNRQILLTGSFNCTRSANSSNKENVIILEDESIINSYIKEFIMLKKSCLPISGQNQEYINSNSKLKSDEDNGFWSNFLGLSWLF